MKACITCHHCDVLEQSGQSFLVCDLEGDENLKFINPKDICKSFKPSVFADVLGFDLGDGLNDDDDDKSESVVEKASGTCGVCFRACGGVC